MADKHNKHNNYAGKTFYLLELQSFLRTFYGFSSNKYSKDRVITAVLSDVVTLILKVISEYHPRYLFAVVYDMDDLDVMDGTHSYHCFDNQDFKAIHTATVLILKSLKVPFVKTTPKEYNSILSSQQSYLLSLGAKSVLISNDKLFYQMVSDHSVIVDPYINKFIDIAAVKDRFKVSPQLVPDIIGLVGSNVHGIQGVASIGEKAAIDLILRYGSLECVLENKHLIPKFGDKLALHEQEALASKKLAKFSALAVGTTPLLNLDALEFFLDDEAFQKALKSYGLGKLITEKFHGKSSYYSSSTLIVAAKPAVWPVLDRLDLNGTINNNIISKYGINDIPPTRTAFIYALVDPRAPKNFKYVGKTINTKDRLKSHISRASKRLTPKDEWLCQLQADGITPQIVILEEVGFRYECEWGDREHFFITYYFNKGFKLLNTLPGGPAFSVPSTSNGEFNYTMEQHMIDRLKLWLESPSHERSVKVWETKIALSFQHARIHGGIVCKYCGIHLPKIKLTPSNPLPFSDILPYPPISKRSLWVKEQELHEDGCNWWKG